MRSKRTSRFREIREESPHSDQEEGIATSSAIEKEEAKTVEEDEFLRFYQQMQRLERGEGYVEILH